MGQPRRDFALKARTDVNVRIGRTAGEQPDICDRVWRQASGFMLGKGESIARQRIDGVERGSADNAMIPMAQIPRERMLRVMSEENRRAPTSNPEHEVSTQGARILNLPVGVAKEDNLSETQQIRRDSRLCLASQRDLGCGRFRIV